MNFQRAISQLILSISIYVLGNFCDLWKSSPKRIEDNLNQGWKIRAETIFTLNLVYLRYEITINWNPSKSKFGKNHKKCNFLWNSRVRTADLWSVRPTRYHCTIFKPESRWEKTCVYKESIHFCQENIEWSGSGVEQKSGILHLFNLSKIDRTRF